MTIIQIIIQSIFQRMRHIPVPLGRWGYHFERNIHNKYYD